MRVGYMQVFNETQMEKTAEEWMEILNVERLFVDTYVPGPLKERPKFKFLIETFFRPGEGDVLVIDSIASLNPDKKEWADVERIILDQDVVIEFHKEKVSSRNSLWHVVMNIYMLMWDYFHKTWSEYQKPEKALCEHSLQGVHYRKD